MSVQKEIKQEIGKGKLWSKVEDKLSNNNLGSAWENIRTMADLTDNVQKRRVQEFHMFYARFDLHDFNNKKTIFKNLN